MREGVSEREREERAGAFGLERSYFAIRGFEVRLGVKRQEMGRGSRFFGGWGGGLWVSISPVLRAALA